MIRLITEVFRMPGGQLTPLLYALKKDGQLDHAVTNTLCDFVTQLFPPSDKEFEDLLALVKSGTYVPSNPLLADFGVNDINAWLAAPYAVVGGIAISNENTSEYSSEEGKPQQFSIAEYKATSECWKKFLNFIQERGAESVVGQKYELLVP